MTTRTVLRLLFAAAVATGLALSPAADAAPKKGKRAKPARKVDYKLKKGATGTICLGCHTDFEDLVKKASVHTPVKTRKCVGCHSPHASEHGTLLSTDADSICRTCHDKNPKQAVSRHEPTRQGKCIKCHEVHAADSKPLLSKPELDTCAECHGDIVRQASGASHKHRPLEKDGCTTCHDPHSSQSERLLKKPARELCAGCHKVTQKWFPKIHNGYEGADIDCTGCHNPHGSSQPGMLYDSVHPPVAKRACGQCHEPAQRNKPPTTKKVGVELCKTCHAKEIRAMVAKDRVHWALLDQRACLNCHNPHASPARKLLRSDPGRVCGSCHADTIARQQASPTKHKPVANDCVKCHDPHSSNNVLMFQKANPLELCGACHDWRKHSSHPVGTKYKDPRNPNLHVTCLSCHRSHGTEHEHLLPTATTTELCVQCHESFRR